MATASRPGQFPKQRSGMPHGCASCPGMPSRKSRDSRYPDEELREQEFLQYIHPDDRPAIIAEWDRLAQGGALRDQEYRVVTRAGQIRWCSSSWEPMRDESGRQIGDMGTEFDITERKLAEEEMRLDTELFQAVIEVQQAVAAAGLDSATVMHVIAERSLALTSASGVVIEILEQDA